MGIIRIKSEPTLIKDVFRDALVRVKSPVLLEYPGYGDHPADVYWDICVNREVNPGIALGFFWKESQFATDRSSATRVKGLRNWGHLRPFYRPGRRWYKKVAFTYAGVTGYFAAYRTYADSLRDWCELWNISLYRGRHLADVLTDYAPTGDNNSPTGYYSTVRALLLRWRQQSGLDVPIEVEL